MRESTFAQVCALAILSFAVLGSSATPARAAFFNIYGGPTYSDAAGGYLPGGLVSQPLTPIGFITSVTYGNVNDAGIAVGNLWRFDAPLSGSLQNTYSNVLTWSASSSPIVLNSGSPTTGAWAVDMNNSGAVVGATEQGLVDQQSTDSINSDSTQEAYTPAQWNIPATNVINLNGISSSRPHNFDVAVAINSLGVTIGTATKFDSSGTYQGPQPVSWVAGSTTPTQLGNLIGDPNTNATGTAVALNNSGTIVGSSTVMRGVSTTEAVRWDTSASAPTMLGNLGTPAGKDTAGIAASINDSGTAVGYVTKYNASGGSLGRRAVRWDASGTTATELGNLGTDANGVAQLYATAINSSGVIIGNEKSAGTPINQRELAVLWNPGSTTPVPLASLGITNFGLQLQSVAFALNSQGIVVGEAQTVTTSGPFTQAGPYHAVYWNPDGSVVDLNSLIDPSSGWTLTSANTISDTGWILGLGTFDPDGAGGQSSYQRLFIIQVPEPSSLLLAVLGFSCIAVKFRRALQVDAVNHELIKPSPLA